MADNLHLQAGHPTRLQGGGGIPRYTPRWAGTARPPPARRGTPRGRLAGIRHAGLPLPPVGVAEEGAPVHRWKRPNGNRESEGGRWMSERRRLAGKSKVTSQNLAQSHLPNLHNAIFIYHFPAIFGSFSRVKKKRKEHHCPTTKPPAHACSARWRLMKSSTSAASQSQSRRQHCASKHGGPLGTP